jgi:hypothetical protein
VTGRRRAEALVLAVAVVLAGVGVSVTTDRPARQTAFAGSVLRPADGGTLDAPAVPTEVERLHGRGVTGENVTVGVVAVTGIDRDHPHLAGRLVGVRSFGGDDRAGAHGTATALTVATVAPDADLLAATAGTPAAAADAVGWLTDRDADVIVVPATELGAPGDGTGRLASAVDRAAAAGSLAVVPSGNLARNHWAGRLSPTASGRHRFGETTRLRLRPPVASGGAAGGVVRLWLRWNGTAYPRDLTVELYRQGATATDRVATSERVRTGAVRIERLTARVRPGDLFVTVRLPNRTVRRFEPLPVRIEVTAARHRLSNATQAGSIAAPATAEDALVVGAYDRRAGRVAGYSARGPTVDGRRGVDLVARTDVWSADTDGTSAGTAYAGGVAALLADADPTAGPDDLRRALRTSADDVGPAGPDPASGHGRLDASEGVAVLVDGAASGDETAGVERRTDARRPPRATAPRQPASGTDTRRSARTTTGAT